MSHLYCQCPECKKDAPGYKSPDSAREEIRKLQDLLVKCEQFIGYTSYKLDVGKAQIGDQFPKRHDADILIAKIQEAVGRV